MHKTITSILLAAFPFAIGAQGWQGAEAEKAYDQQLDAKRAAGDLNNDDYYEIHKDGRIYAFSDLKDYRLWLQTDEVPLVVTKIGVGPNGETVKLQLSKKDAKAMEKQVGYRGPTEKLWTGEVAGAKDFHGEIVRANRYYVFNDWNDLVAFRKTGEAACGVTKVGAGPAGKTVVFVQSCKAAEKGQPETTIARFKANYDLH